MHFFFTGARQVGKSTIITKVLAKAGISPGGFVTVFALEHGTRTLYLLPPDAPRAFDPTRVVARFVDGLMRAEPSRFDSLGTERIQCAQNAPLILMDECGFLERDALRFQQAVISALDGNRPVLGVVRQNAGGWTERIHNHPNVAVHTVTPENRDEMENLAYHWLVREVTS